MARIRLIALILMVLTLAGCGNSASNRLLGKWKCDFTKALLKQMGEKSQGNSAAALGIAQAFGANTTMEMTIEFKSDQTGNVSTTGIPFPFDGAITWKTIESQGDKITVEIANPKEKQTSKLQITFLDNDHLRFSPPNTEAKSMEFERVKQ
jgi:uncharacterized lipoprotein NlpE involved in copper resistance